MLLQATTGGSEGRGRQRRLAILHWILRRPNRLHPSSALPTTSWPHPPQAYEKHRLLVTCGVDTTLCWVCPDCDRQCDWRTNYDATPHVVGARLPPTPIPKGLWANGSCSAGVECQFCGTRPPEDEIEEDHGTLPGANCPEGHGLGLYQTPKSSYSCDR